MTQPVRLLIVVSHPMSGVEGFLGIRASRGRIDAAYEATDAGLLVAVARWADWLAVSAWWSTVGPMGGDDRSDVRAFVLDWS